jgi:hypothetical protein
MMHEISIFGKNITSDNGYYVSPYHLVLKNTQGKRN